MRNPPDHYLAILKRHFSTSTLNSSSKERVADLATKSTDGWTTNQLGRIAAFQRWFNFKEAFAPSFVVESINSLGTRPKHVIDPFGGSGTTAITCQLLGIPTTTIEVNPFLADIIRAKTASLDADYLRKSVLDFQLQLSRTPPDLSIANAWPSTFVESEDKDRWIFPKDVAERITQYLLAIGRIKDGQVQRLLKVCLGAVLIGVSNVYINGKGRRYRRSWQSNQASAEQLDLAFQEQFGRVFEDCVRFEERLKAEVNVIGGDSRAELGNLTDKADLIVFSPPYPNSFDYTDIYNVELWVLGYLNSVTDNSSLRISTLRSHVQVARKFDPPEDKSPTLLKAYRALTRKRSELWDAKLPEMVSSYFLDLQNVLSNSHRLLSKNGKVIMVVGDSRYAGVLIDVGTILTEIAPAIGFSRAEKHEVRKMRVSAQQGGGHNLREWIVELRR